MTKKESWLIVSVVMLLSACSQQTETKDTFPNGEIIPEWFSDYSKVNPEDLGEQFVITDHGVVNDSTLLQTAEIQMVIDKAHEKGGGVIVIPEGVYLSGALFFKPNTHLHIREGAVLKGSDNIENYPIMPSRMEGQNLDYFPALVNAYSVNGFTISGHGTINGNGLKFWKAFWQRRKENPKCTNLEVSRPRLVFIQHSNNVQLQDVNLINAGFWTTHYYKCDTVKILDLYVYSPSAPIKAPSTDAIDIDACNTVLVKGCYLSVNDDAIALKGGKGPWADTDTANGGNSNIIIEDCEFGFCHSAMTCGSESIHNKNVIMRRIKVKDAKRVFWLKMRPDTPQKYEYISVEDIEGSAQRFIYVKPWRQFFDLKGKEEVPISYSSNISFKNINLSVDKFFDVAITEYDRLSNFTMENVHVQAKDTTFNKKVVDGFVIKNVTVKSAL